MYWTKKKIVLTFGLFAIINCQAQTMIVSQGSNWSYFDQGYLPASNWNSPSFNSSGWANGPAKLGYGDPDIATIVSYGQDINNKFTTTYFRKEVNLTTVADLDASVKYDDGIVVYVNGNEVFRANMPNGTINYNTFASTFISQPDENTWHSFTINASDLTSGNNIIAVEIHQSDLSSSDKSFDCQLIMDNSNCSPYIINNEITLCNGQSTNFFGQTLTQTGIYTHTVSDTTRIKTSPVPVGAIRWDAWSEIIYDQSITNTYNDHAVIEATALSMEPSYRAFAPFHAINIPQVNVNVNTVYNQGTGWQFESRWYDMDFRGEQQWVMDAELDYAVESGIDYFMFLFYADASPLCYGRQLYTSTPDKKGIKMAYQVGQLGGDPEQSIQTIVNAMNQPWYQKIDGKPLVFFDSPEKMDMVIQAYGSDQIYAVLQRIYPTASLNDVPEVVNNQMDAINWYSSFGDNQILKTYQTISEGDVNSTNMFLNQPIETVPTLTISFYNKPRVTHGHNGMATWDTTHYVNMATDLELKNHLENMLNICEENPTKIKTLLLYSWNEHTEGCKVLCPTKNVDGTINKSVVDVFESVLYSTPNCDTIYNLDLTVENPDVTVTFSGNTLVANEIPGASYQWFNCTTNNLIPGANGSSYTPDTSGEYYVVLSLNDNCESTSSCNSVFLGLIEDNIDLLRVYPNPANSNLNVTIHSNQGTGTLKIHDLRGNLLIETLCLNELEIDISNLTQGVYVVTVEFEKARYQSKFTKI